MELFDPRTRRQFNRDASTRVEPGNREIPTIYSSEDGECFITTMNGKRQLVTNPNHIDEKLPVLYCAMRCATSAVDTVN
jgi:hypothetical protein